MASNARSLILAFLLALFTGLSHFAHAAEVAPALNKIVGIGIERGIARVVCTRRESEFPVRFRAVVVDLGDPVPKHDVLLAPAHGLPQDMTRIKQDCRVVGGGAMPTRIAEVWFSSSRNAGLGDDWAVLMTRSALNGPVGRLRLGQVSEDVLERLIVDEKPIAVMLASEVADQRNCRAIESLGSGVFSHSCSSWAGLSGSPILIDVDNQPVVIGIQIGRVSRLAQARGPLFRGAALVINDTIAAAIRQAAVRARARETD